MDTTTTSRPPLARTASRPETTTPPRRTRPAPRLATSTWWRGRSDDPSWVRPALLALLSGTALLYLVGLSASGYANSFYSAAAQAGSESWKALFFASSDAANSITVDKTPMSIWVMALSVKIFGLSSWSILAPQALMGVGTVGLLYATVRRSTGHAWAGLLAGAALALTPVATLMFRFNNPDALLVLLLVASVWATLRALDDPARSTRWLLLAGTFVGFGFLTKMLQAFLVLPALAGVYLLCATVPLWRRVLQSFAALAAVIVSAGWWIAAVELWPANSRPYIGGSQNNSILELTLGYNGLGRLNGEETGSVGGGGGWGETGLFRMVSDSIGGQVAWLLPASLVALGLVAWTLRSRWGAARTEARTAGTVVWGIWLIVTTLTFSFMAGIFHEYYTVALAPAIAALVAIGAVIAVERRDDPVVTGVAGFALALTSAWSFLLLQRTPDFLPWLRWLVIAVGAVGAVGWIMHRWLPRRALALIAGATLVTALAGPTAYALDTAASANTGSIPTAGPGTGGGPGGGPGGGQPPQGTLPGQATGGQNTATGPGGGAGGLLNASTPSDAVTDLLLSDADAYTWVAAAIGSNSAAGFQLATEAPVMAVGGFNGSDPSPTLEQFQQYVADGEIHWFIAAGGGMGGGPGGGGPQAGGSTSSEITAWVEANFEAQTVDGVTLYDLSGGVA